MSHKPVVLFLCTHNAGRSLAARVLLDRYADGRIDVRSAGRPRTPSRRTTSPRPSRSPSTWRTWCRVSMSPTTPSCRHGCSPTSTPRSPVSAVPDWNQLPINRAHVPINDMLRDGFHQDAVHGGAAPYRPNRLDGDCPFIAGHDNHAFIDVPATVQAGVKERAQPASFDAHFSQVGLFFRSMSPIEQDHITAAYTFELSKFFDEAIRQWQLQALANIDGDLCKKVADGLGLEPPKPTVSYDEATPSPGLSQVGGSWPVAGHRSADRQIGRSADRRHHRLKT